MERRSPSPHYTVEEGTREDAERRPAVGEVARSETGHDGGTTKEGNAQKARKARGEGRTRRQEGEDAKKGGGLR